MFELQFKEPRLIGPHTMVLPLQNGIDSAERLAQIVGPAAVLGGVAYVISTRVAPGVIVHHGLNKIIFGEYKGGTSRRTEQLRDMLRRTAVTGELHPDIRVPLWERFILLAATGGVMAMTRLHYPATSSTPVRRAGGLRPTRVVYSVAGCTHSGQGGIPNAGRQGR